jgi:hypothetical protein
MGDMQDARKQNHGDGHAGYQVLTTNTLTAKKEPRRMRARKYRKAAQEVASHSGYSTSTTLDMVTTM